MIFCRSGALNPPKSGSVNTISTVSERFENGKGADSRKKPIFAYKMVIFGVLENPSPQAKTIQKNQIIQGRNVTAIKDSNSNWNRGSSSNSTIKPAKSPHQFLSKVDGATFCKGLSG